jgi:hypothetical protein
LEKSAGKALSEQRERLYQLQKQKLEEYANAVLLTREAKKSGVPVEALLDRKVIPRSCLPLMMRLKSFTDPISLVLAWT